MKLKIMVYNNEYQLFSYSENTPVGLHWSWVDSVPKSKNGGKEISFETAISLFRANFNSALEDAELEV